MIALKSAPAFELGTVFLTIKAKDKINALGMNPIGFINRHVHCDWGELSQNDRVLNSKALQSGQPIVSAYRLDRALSSDLLYVMTKANRSETYILLPEECHLVH